MEFSKLEQTNIEIQGIPDFVLAALSPVRNKLIFNDNKKMYEITYSAQDENKKIEQELQPSVFNNLYNFQKEGVKFGLQNNGRVLIADEMVIQFQIIKIIFKLSFQKKGVGKTIQSICLAACFKQSWPLLIICPSSLKYNWKEEVIKWVSNISEQQVQIFAKQMDNIFSQTKVLICSYDIVPKIVDKILKFKTDIVIADEAHYLKNIQAKRTNTLVPILQKIKHVILLTGTPAFARPKEMYTLLSILRPDIFKDFKQFGDRFCNPKLAKFGGGIDYSGSSNEKELNYMLKKSLMIRRLKSEVLTQLPKKRRKKIHVNVDPKIMSQIQEILNQTNKSSLEQLFDVAIKQNEENQEKPKSGLSIFSALSLCYQLSGQAKLQELKNYIKDLLENDIKVIIFAHHQDMLNQLESYVVNELKLKSIRIDGQVHPQERFERVQKFQKDETVKVAVLSLAAASTGLTLTASSNIVFAEMHWTPAIMQQAEDRAHRIGQENSVLCHYIVGEKTLDDMLYKKIEQKIAIVSNILDGELKSLQIDEVQNAQGDILTYQLDPQEYNNGYLNQEVENQFDKQLNGIQQNSINKQQDSKQNQFNQKSIQQLNNIQIMKEVNQQDDTVPNHNFESNNIKNQQNNMIQINNFDFSNSDSDSDSEELFALKLLAKLEAKKLKNIDIEKNTHTNQNNIFQVSNNQSNNKQTNIQDNNQNKLNQNTDSKLNLNFESNMKLQTNNQSHQMELLKQNNNLINKKIDQNKSQDFNQYQTPLVKQENNNKQYLDVQNFNNKQNVQQNITLTPSKSVLSKKNVTSNNKINNNVSVSKTNQNSLNSKIIEKSENEFLFDSESSDSNNSNKNKKIQSSKQSLSFIYEDQNKQQNNNSNFSINIINPQNQVNFNQNSLNQTPIQLKSNQDEISNNLNNNNLDDSSNNLIKRSDKSNRFSTGFDFLDDAIDELSDIDDNLKNKSQPINENENQVHKNNILYQKNNLFEINSSSIQENKPNSNPHQKKISPGFQFLEDEINQQKSSKENENKQKNNLFESNTKQRNSNNQLQVSNQSNQNKIFNNQQIQNKFLLTDSLQQFIYSDKKQIKSPNSKQYLNATPQKPFLNSNSKYETQSIQSQSKKSAIKSVEKDESGISKITYDNGDVKYVSDSNDEEIQELNFMTNFNNKHFIKDNNQNRNNQMNSNENTDDDEYYFVEQNNNQQNKNNSNQIKEQSRNIRSRKDFESDYSSNNKLNMNGNNIYDQISPQKQDVTKKKFFKQPQQNF